MYQLLFIKVHSPFADNTDSLCAHLHFPLLLFCLSTLCGCSMYIVLQTLILQMSENIAFDSMRYLMFEMGFRRHYKPDMVALQVRLNIIRFLLSTVRA